MRQGRHRDAMALTRQALEESPIDEPKVLAELATAAAAAATLAGDPSADRRIRQAETALEHAEGIARLEARLLSFKAMAATRHGDLASARDDYERALDVIETAELEADLPTYLLNAGTAHDHLGDLDS